MRLARCRVPISFKTVIFYMEQKQYLCIHVHRFFIIENFVEQIPPPGNVNLKKIKNFEKTFENLWDNVLK